MVKYPLFKLMRLEKSHLHGYFNNIHFILCSVKKNHFTIFSYMIQVIHTKIYLISFMLWIGVSK
jgi:hypothetical protein